MIQSTRTTLTTKPGEKMAKVNKVSEYSAGTKYILIIFSVSSTYVEADQRSIDAPGHGYPAHTEHHNSFELLAFEEESKLKEKVEQLLKRDPNRTDFLILPVGDPIKVTQSITLNPR